MSEIQANPTSTEVVPPGVPPGVVPWYGLLQASVDSKGRLKLPERALASMKAGGVKKVFVTTFDLKQARIYPIEVWAHNEKVFRTAGANSAAAERLAYLANFYGGEDEVDGAGRLLIPARLREVLGLDEKAPVWLGVHNGRINVVTKAAHDELMAAAEANMASDRAALEASGML